MRAGGPTDDGSGRKPSTVSSFFGQVAGDSGAEIAEEDGALNAERNEGALVLGDVWLELQERGHRQEQALQQKAALLETIADPAVGIGELVPHLFIRAVLGSWVWAETPRHLAVELYPGVYVFGQSAVASAWLELPVANSFLVRFTRDGPTMYFRGFAQAVTAVLKEGRRKRRSV